MNPVDYFQPAALRRYIRNPASVRDWPGRSMPAFPPDQLSDREPTRSSRISLTWRGARPPSNARG